VAIENVIDFGLAKLRIFLNYTRALRFNNKPNYSYLRELFDNVYIRKGYRYGIFSLGVQRGARDDGSAGTSGRKAATGGRKVVWGDILSFASLPVTSFPRYIEALPPIADLHILKCPHHH
jgi:hypothetical protein